MIIKSFGKRLCTFCGDTMVYFMFEGSPLGACACGNTDECFGEKTPADVMKRYGDRMEPYEVWVEAN